MDILNEFIEENGQRLVAHGIVLEDDKVVPLEIVGEHLVKDGGLSLARVATDVQN